MYELRVLVLALLLAACHGPESGIAPEESGQGELQDANRAEISAVGADASSDGLADAQDPAQESIAAAWGPLLQFRGHGMGVPVTLTFAAPLEVDALGLSRELFSELHRLESLVNLWNRESELARWNGGLPEGGWVPEELAELVGTALELCAATGGVFDPTVGSALAESGHYEQVDEGRSVGASTPVSEDGDSVPQSDDSAGHARAVGVLGCDRVNLTAGAEGWTLARTHPGVRLDLSGIAKGWAAERLIAKLREAGVENAYLDLGSSTVRAIGPGPTGKGWELRVPDGAGVPESWWLVDEAVSTSGHAWPAAVEELATSTSVLVNPLTGELVDAQPLLVITRGPNALVCDGWSTTIAVHGGVEGLAPPVQVRVLR